jgi:hypothetical protein
MVISNQQPEPDGKEAKMKASIFCLPSVGSRAEIEAGMAATRPELYQRMLKELTELYRASLPHRGLRAFQ